MTPAETLQLFKLVRGYSSGFEVNEATPAVWAHALADVPAADATKAVHAHFAVAGPWIMPADVRRRVAAARGLLPPDPEAAYAQARRMSAWLDRRTGPEPDIHPAAMAAARRIRWSAFDAPDGVAHARFVAAYRPLADAAAEQVLTTPMGELGAAVRGLRAVPGGVGAVAPPDLTAAGDDGPANPTGPAPAPEELHRQLARVAATKTPPPPRADYQPPTAVEVATASDLLRRWAAEHGQPIDDPAELSTTGSQQ